MLLPDKARVVDMIDALRLLMRYAEGRTRFDLDIDPQLRDAVIFRILVLGEAAKMMSAEIQDTCPDFPWRSAIRMRDRLAHGYQNIDLDIVWEVAIKHAPAQLPMLERLLQADPES